MGNPSTPPLGIRVPDGLKMVSGHLDIPREMFELLKDKQQASDETESTLLSCLIERCTRDGAVVDNAALVMLSALWNALCVTLDDLDPARRRELLDHFVDQCTYARDHTIAPYYTRSFGDLLNEDPTGTLRVSTSLCFDSASISEAIASFVSNMEQILDPDNTDVILRIESLPHEISDPHAEAIPTAVRFLDVHANHSKIRKAIDELKETEDD